MSAQRAPGDAFSRMKRDADRVQIGEEMRGFTLDARAVFDASQIDEDA